MIVVNKLDSDYSDSIPTEESRFHSEIETSKDRNLLGELRNSVENRVNEAVVKFDVGSFKEIGPLLEDSSRWEERIPNGRSDFRRLEW